MERVELGGFWVDLEGSGLLQCSGLIWKVPNCSRGFWIAQDSAENVLEATQNF